LSCGGGGLKELLECRGLQKAMYDVRNDADALYAQFGVRVVGAVDVQILFGYTHQERSDPYLKGLGKALDEYGRLMRWTASQRRDMELVKERGLRPFSDEHGGAPSVWRARPLLTHLAIYAALDVRHLLGMLDAWGRDPAKLAAVREKTELRIARALGARRPLEGRERSRCDFDFRGYGLLPRPRFDDDAFDFLHDPFHLVDYDEDLNDFDDYVDDCHDCYDGFGSDYD